MSSQGQNSGKGPTRPSVFGYTDYRAFLRDQFSFAKAQNPAYSFRAFSRIAGFSSPNFLKLVYDGNRNLSLESLQRIAEAFKLSKSEKEFLEDLVQFNQAATTEEKNRHFSRMTRHQQFRKIREIKPDQFDYYSQPFHVALRELVDTADFKEDANWISDRLRMNVSEKQVKDGVELLLEIGLLKRVGGKLELSESSVTTSPEVTSLAIMNFHKEMLKAASESLDSLKGKERDISSVTVAMNAKQLAELKKRVTAFRNSILAWIASSEDSKDEVFQVNFQIFPLTERKKGDPK